MKHFDFIGLGIGPFHLSLASLMEKAKDVNALFLDQRPEFAWHPELLFGDADMQTSYIKDLVTPIDPTNHCSFMNYLVEKGLFYAFVNTGRSTITRIEFDQYCRWVSSKLSRLQFSTKVERVSFKKDKFLIETNQGSYSSTNISVATGLTPRIPEFAKGFLGRNVFHAKSPQLRDLDLRERRVLIIGGGQTGVEIFRNSILGNWGRVKSVKLISRRGNLEPLDESPFTNEFFTPSYVDQFIELDKESRSTIVKAQKLASDGNTPQYLEKLYHDLYQLRHVRSDDLDFKLLPCRDMIALERDQEGYRVRIRNNFLKTEETTSCDVVILCTGFTSTLPPILDPLLPELQFDSEGKIEIGRNFDLKWKGPKENKIYALNFSRHKHGIAEPQTSLMAWRSAMILNDLTQKELYKTNNSVPTFIHYGSLN